MESPKTQTPTGAPPWNQIASGEDFHDLLRSKARFIVSGTAFFLVYYFALPILTGYWPEWMSQKVFSHFSLAYVFALTQFPMAWILAGAYLRAASRFDRDAARIVARHLPQAAASPELPSATSNPENSDR